MNALAAAEELIVPIQCEYYALEGLGQLLRNVRLVQQNVNQHLRLTGIVMTMFDPRTKLSEQVVAEVRRYFGDRVYQTIIPRTVRLSEAPGFGQPITVYDPRSRGAQCYRDLAAEVVVKLPDETPLPVIEDLPTMTMPPPEPAPTRAPRPLVGVDDEFEETLSTADEVVEVDGADDPAPERDATVEAPRRVGRGSTAGTREPAAEVDTEAEPGASTDDTLEAPEPAPLVQEESAPPEEATHPIAVDEPAPSGEEQDRVEPEEPKRAMPARVILGEAEPESDVEAPDPEPSTEDPATTEPKRRWGLFRRGT